MSDVLIKTFRRFVLISYSAALIQIVELPNFSKGIPFQNISPLGLSSILKNSFCFFKFDNVFAKDISYSTPS